MPEAAASVTPTKPETKSVAAPERLRWVPETKFGHWFLGTKVWSRYVVEVALKELSGLLPVAARRPRRILDAGSGPGVSLPMLARYFEPELIIAIDIDPQEIARTQAQVPHCSCRVEVTRADLTRLDMADGSVDMVLCHQTLHHVVRQTLMLKELFRVLAPGGSLLLAESCRDFIHSAPVRLLFRHPNEVQKTAAQYQEMVRAAGFEFGPEHVVTSTPFWSLPDWGFFKKIGRKKRPAVAEPTEVYLVAFKPGA